eukprot:COSAG01_NODE_499_length_16240_cov_43.337092_9_plen_79_part_00
MGKDPLYEALLERPEILAWPAHILGRDRFKLSSFNGRVVPPRPGCDSAHAAAQAQAQAQSLAGAQPLHADMMARTDAR